MGTIQSIFEKSENFNQFLNNYLVRFQETLLKLNGIDGIPLVKAILECHQNGNKVIVMGNGGSAANALHISTGLSYITRNWDNPIKSLALTGDSTLISSLANDFSFDEIFYRQLQVHLEEGDIILALSVSGRSKNIIKALQYAKAKNNLIIGLTGFDGGEFPELVDHLIHIQDSECLLGMTEDTHMVLGHVLSYYLEYHFQSLKKI
jgi:D-sedoheptulose 7-phosphate isomerase